MAVRLVPYDRAWPERFEALAAVVRGVVGAAALRIDHIGSTSVPGLAAKDVIDMQVTVASLDDADRWPDAIGPFLRRTNTEDHPPPGCQPGPDWEKRYWSAGTGGHLHVRRLGAANQRYALVFRDYLRATPAAAQAYERAKRALAPLFDDTGSYAEAKDPVCDLVVHAAELWADATRWDPTAPLLVARPTGLGAG